MSKLRRSSFDTTPKRDKNENLNVNKKKLISHSEFLNRIRKSMYYGRARVSIPLSDYITEAFSETHDRYSLNRLDNATVGKLRTTPYTLIIAMIYFERLKDTNPAYCKHVTPTELFLISMMVATKFYSGHDDDSPTVNWSELTKTTPDNLLQMELNFLTSLDWNVYVSNDEFFEKVDSIERKLARRQGLHRGWFTYMELNVLMPSVRLSKDFLEITIVLGLSYAAFVATIIASVFLVGSIPGTYLNTTTNRLQKTSTNHTVSFAESEPTSIDAQTTMNTQCTELTNRCDDAHVNIDSIIRKPNSTEESSSENDTFERSMAPIYNLIAKLLGSESFNWSVILNNRIRDEAMARPLLRTTTKFSNISFEETFNDLLFRTQTNPVMTLRTNYRLKFV